MSVFCCSLFLVLIFQYSWAAVPRTTKLQLKTSLVKTPSPFPIFSGDHLTLSINVKHTSKSRAQAVDVVLEILIPFYFKVLSHTPGNGVVPSSVEKPEITILKFKFNKIYVSKSVTLSLLAAVDPYFTPARNGSHHVSAEVKLWYYGEDGPCARPPSLYNAEHEQGRIDVDFISTTACDQQIQVSKYFVSSISTHGQANASSFSNPGVWITADSQASDKNQFLHLDFSRTFKVSKIATRGQTTPFVAFVRTYHVYHSKNSIEWSACLENGDIKVFEANRDAKNVAFDYMTTLIHARYLRIVPRSWKRRQAMDVQVFGCAVHPREDLADYCPLFDFENGVADWEKTGTAFDNQPTVGDNLKVRKGKSANIQGNAWIATAENRMRSYMPAGDTQGDTPVGTLTSPKFLIATSNLHFLIGGSANNSAIRAELVIDGKSVRKASGDSDELKETTWYVKSFLGKEAVLRLVDESAVGHLNFDAFRMDCFLDGDAQNMIVPSRGVMLNPRTHSFYVCDSSHLRRQSIANCRMTRGSSDIWNDITGVVALLGVDIFSNQLYAISKDRYVITSVSPAGGNWRYIKRSEWDEVKGKATMKGMNKVSWVTLQDGVPEEVLLTLHDNNGDQWRATSHGIGFKPAGQNWVDIAAWSCQASDLANDPCFSEPCENHSNCTVSHDQYSCSCLPGYTGVNCEQDINECLNNVCENGGTCVQGINYYFCRCSTGFSGTNCENVLPTCRTSPCLHGGTCIDETPPAFRCACINNYRGSVCEIVYQPCESKPCRNGGVCVPSDEGYDCICPYGFYGTVCQSALKSNFVVVETRSVTETNTYLVIKARIPSHGLSFTENWCRDYERLCSENGGGREPTGFGYSYNHIREYASCQEKYQSVMDRANVLGANPNEKVAALAQQVGFTDATSTNSFAFNACDGQKCSRILPESGCHEGLSCISRDVPNLEVYTVCIDSDTKFKVINKKWEIYKGVRLLLLHVNAPDQNSKFDTWCTDYDMVCKRYGLRTIGTERNEHCEYTHRVIIHKGMRVSDLADIMGKDNGFLFKDCASCNHDSYSTYNALYYFKYYYRDYTTACAHPHGIGFKVLDDQRVNDYSGKDYMAVKVQVPSNGLSNDTNWCKDYQLLCESYNMVPIGCGDCVSKYKSSFTSCPVSGVEQIIHSAGFSDASSTNTFVYTSCSACSNHVIQNECQNNDLFCIEQDNTYRVFYTLCLKGREKALHVIASKSITHQSLPYTVLKLQHLPLNGQPVLDNWCEEYQALCEDIGGQPVGCGPSYSSDPDVATCGDTYGSAMNNDLLCGSNTDVLEDLLDNVGFYSSPYNTFMFYNCSSEACATPLSFGCTVDCTCHPALGCISNSMSSSSRTAYTICHMYTSAFKVLETVKSQYNEHEVLVIKAQIPSDGFAKLGNWCEDYKTMCFYYGYRPTGCGQDYADDIRYSSCMHDYGSVMPSDNAYGCPATTKIALIAKAAGFLSATSGNSFGFSDCEETCVSALTTDGPFIDLSVTDGVVYTICETSDSHFKVLSTKKGVHNGGEYMFVQAQVPQDLISKHNSWCTDYQRMCESFGLRPVSSDGHETEYDKHQCRKQYGSINPKFPEATYYKEVVSFGRFLGYSDVTSYPANVFVLHQDCYDRCYNDIKKDYFYLSLFRLSGEDVAKHDYMVYTVCASSDSNFHVVSTKNIAHKGQDYLVIMAKLPASRRSKYENWCRDYERLCRSFRKRPTGCGRSFQWSSKHISCVDKYQSAMATNDPVGCNSSEAVASLANMAGFSLANQNNSFAFHQCSDTCPNELTDSCPDSLPCLNSGSDVVYTVCTDSSSAFEVERVVNTQEGGVPLLLITATLNGVTKAKSGDWCRDYQKLCNSYAARPVSCYSNKNDDKAACASDYYGVAIDSDKQGCGDDGYEDIKRLVTLTPGLESGQYFKFEKCSKSKCKKTLSDEDCHDSLNCLSNSDYVYTVCTRAKHNFQDIDTASTSSEEFQDILVVKAAVPVNGQSRFDSWCEDYTKMCSVYGKVPLACPLRRDYVAESLYRSCAKDYNGYMMRNELPCPSNEFIADVAKKAGFNEASKTNTLMLTTCLSCSKTLHLVNGSYLAMSCPSNAVCRPWQNLTLGVDVSRQVYMLCVKARNVSTFHVDEIRHVTHYNRKYAAVRVSLPYGTISIFDDWCSDYQKVCESISMRPIACGQSYERMWSRRECRSKYNAVMPREFGCNSQDDIAAIARSAGFHYDKYRTFSLNDCNKCRKDLFASDGLFKITRSDGFFYTACSSSDSSFEVLQTRGVLVNEKSYFVIKAQLPADMTSSHETWCKDYQMMCESYGKRPLTCSDFANCQSSYNALLLDNNCNSLYNIPLQAGFIDATANNTFVFKSCDTAKCSRRFPDVNTGSPFGSLNSSVSHHQVYTFCLNSATAFEVRARRDYQEANGRSYLFLQVAMPENGTSNFANWCEDYTELCREYGSRPVACASGGWCSSSYGAIKLTEQVCPIDNMLSFAENAATSESMKETNFLFSFYCYSKNCKKVVETRNCTKRGKEIPECFDREVNHGEFTTVCATPTDITRFPTLDWKAVKYSGRSYVVIRTQKRHRDSVSKNWCEDYRNLCKSFSMRPLACPTRYHTNPDLHLCQRNYGAVSMETTEQGCPLNKFVAELARYAGFTRANPQNSFAFQNCNAYSCSKSLPLSEVGECSEALYCMNMMGEQDDLYTACTESDSAFSVKEYKANVQYNSGNYGVIKVYVEENYKSVHEDWCKDYERLCQSFGMEAVQCNNAQIEVASDICANHYGAHHRLQSCAQDAKQIATKAALGHVADKSTLIMKGCKSCPNVVSKKCSSALDCLRSGTLYAVCAMPRYVYAFQPIQTRPLNYGNNLYLLIQTYLRNIYAASFKGNYDELCKLYGYKPIACGRQQMINNYGFRSCLEHFQNALSSEGEDFKCPPAKTIEHLAKKIGFYEAKQDNTFAFYKCNAYASYSRYRGGHYLSSSSCYTRLWCFKGYQYLGLYYTMCARPQPSPSLGFHVLDKKELMFLGIKYVAFKLSIGNSGKSATDNWCYDYRELCRRYNLVPTGCGVSMKSNPGYLKCSTSYRSFMSYRNSLGCSETSVPSNLVRRAGFPDAGKQNTFVFNDCSKCGKTLVPGACDAALNCLHSQVFNTHAYTLCADRKSGFEYLGKSKTIYGGVEFLVVKAALPVDNRAYHENWCVDYQKLCYSFGSFPVACSLGPGVQDLRRYAEKYGAVPVESIPCPPAAKVRAIVQKAGYTAEYGNAFVFTGYSSYGCSKVLYSTCTPGLDCLTYKYRVVHAVCTNPTNFVVSDVRETRHSNHIFTVVEAKLPASGLSKASSWCQEYATLCRSMKQQPIVCQGYTYISEHKKCSDDYDGYMLANNFDCKTAHARLHEIPLHAGFSEANFANTFGLASCAACARELHSGPDCDPSLSCINNKTTQVYALCYKHSNHSSFQVLETKEIVTSEVQYMVVMAKVSSFGISKYDSWCMDYERMCSTLEMRPVRCSSAGNTCPLLFKALVSSQEQFDCHNNSALVQFVKNAGFSQASTDNSFIYSACSTSSKCRKTLLSSKCDSSMNCLKKPSRHVLFTLCARSRKTSFKYLESRTHVFKETRYFVIKTSISSPESKNVNWCYDYRDMCVSFGKQPIVRFSFVQKYNSDRKQCFDAYNATSTIEYNPQYNHVMNELSMKSGCRVVYNLCKNCVKNFDRCPFENCGCADGYFYLFCL